MCCLRLQCSSAFRHQISHVHPTQTVFHIRPYHASVLPSRISSLSPDFRSKSEAMDVLVADLEDKLAISRQGGGEKARLRMKEKGKLLPRERYADAFFRRVSSYKSPICLKAISSPRPEYAFPRVITDGGT